MTERRSFDEMLRTAVEWLNGRIPEDVAQRAGIDFDAEHSAFAFESLGKTLKVSYPQYRFEPNVSIWQQLVLLHILARADGTPLTGAYQTFAHIKDGMFRGGDFDRRCEETIQRHLGKLTPGELAHRCRAIGGKLVESNADLCAVFCFAPRCPILLKLWYGEEDFLPASGRLLVDTSADHYLTIEDAVAAGELILEKLKDKPCEGSGCHD